MYLGLKSQMPAMPLLAHPAVRTTDREVALGILKDTLAPMHVEFGSSSGTFEFQLCSVNLGRLELQTIEQRIEGGVIAHMQPARDTYAIEIPVMGSGHVSHQGENVSLVAERSAVVTSPDQDSRWCDPGLHYRALRLQVGRAAVEAKFNVLAGCDRATEICFAPRIDSTQPVGRSFLELVSTVFDSVDKGPSIYAQPSTSAALEDMIVVALLTGLHHSHSHMLDCQAKPIGSYVAERTESYLVANSDNPISIENVAAVAGVSVRSLQRTFRRARGLTPMRFLKDVRLDKARSRLSKGDRNASVTKVAMDSGFGHLGAFGADYRKRFGEPPSQTLQRSQRQRELQRSQHH
ncbi:MAG: AraC family transcriptional regulator [Hyphomicrobiaceae bacterium]